eukprot:scaffold10560_cov133-Isochrysis_galbana.AAC.4
MSSRALLGAPVGRQTKRAHEFLGLRAFPEARLAGDGLAWLRWLRCEVRPATAKCGDERRRLQWQARARDGEQVSG